MAHAHLNLVGGVLLFLFGLYYRVFPAAGRMTLARIQGWLHILGSILFPTGIGIVLVSGKDYIAAPIIGSFVVVLAMALFVIVVFRTRAA